jgi:hypothetical protein
MKYPLILSILALALPAFAAEAPSKKVSARTVVFTELFNEADANDNGSLDFEEFANSYGASPRPVVTEYRFDQMAFGDFDTRGFPILRGISLSTFIATRGGRSINPSRNAIFFYADDNRDGFLTPGEFLATRVTPPSTLGSSQKAFDKLDDNEDGLISAAEWGIEIKG